MPESTIEPQTIKLGSIKNGKANILVRWDVHEGDRTDEMSGKTQTIYTYQECAFRGRNGWALPYAMTSREEVEAYLTSIEGEILDWAQGAKVSL